MPESDQLDTKKTFEDQKDLVIKKIVPTVVKLIDLTTYPVSDKVIYDMIHQRHRHQREDLQVKSKSDAERKKIKRKKHCTSRISEVIKY